MSTMQANMQFQRQGGDISIPCPKPMLAANPKNLPLSFPFMASPKVDGVRAVVCNGVVYARSGKPIPNAYVQQLFGHLHGLDGELVVGDAMSSDCFRATQSGVMARQGQPDLCFMIFDNWTQQSPFYRRMEDLKHLQTNGLLPAQGTVLAHVTLHSPAELDAYEAQCLSQGFEGVMLRKPEALYKFGRSTVNEGGMLKVKRFLDAEAVVLDMEELVHEGQTSTSSGQMGALLVRDVLSGVEFSVGTGFSSSDRHHLWNMNHKVRGKFIRYSYFPTGSKEKPRFPVFLGFRHPVDMQEARA